MVLIDGRWMEPELCSDAKDSRALGWIQRQFIDYYPAEAQKTKDVIVCHMYTKNKLYQIRLHHFVVVFF